MCRSVADCAVIFDAIRGRDDLDPTSRDANLLDPFQVDISQLTVGYIRGMETSAPEVRRSITPRGKACFRRQPQNERPKCLRTSH